MPYCGIRANILKLVTPLTIPLKTFPVYFLRKLAMKRSKDSLSAASDLLSVSDMWVDISSNLDFVGLSSHHFLILTWKLKRDELLSRNIS